MTSRSSTTSATCRRCSPSRPKRTSKPCTSRQTPYVRLDETIVALSWVEAYLGAGKPVNIGADGESLQPPFAVQSDIGLLVSITKDQGLVPFGLLEYAMHPS